MEISCHCQSIRIIAAPPDQVTSCNCSICIRYQTLWGYYDPHEVKISVGDKGEAAYIWGDRMLEFVHCANCGCVTHYRTVPDYPKPKVALNFRMASEESIADIPVRYFNGREMN